MRAEATIAWNTITAEEERLAAFVFHEIHAGYRTLVHIERGQVTLVCWCERCKDVQAYAIDNSRLRGPKSNLSASRVGRQ